MIKRSILYFIIFLFTINLFSSVAQTKDTLQTEKIIYLKNFSEYPKGSSGEPDWKIFSGEWKIVDSLFSIKTNVYDEGVALNVFLFTSYSIETRLRGPRTGLYFNLDSGRSKRNSHMVRFENGEIMWGFFDSGGIYHATGIASVDIDPDSWRTLRVNVDIKKGSYEIYVNKMLVGVNEGMEYKSGFPGLQVSDGYGEFTYFKIEEIEKYVPVDSLKNTGTPQINHLRSFSVSGSGKIVYPISEIGIVQMIDMEGNLLLELNARKSKEQPFSYPLFATFDSLEQIYVIDSSFSEIIVFDRHGKFKGLLGKNVLISPVSLHITPDKKILVCDSDLSLKIFDDNWNLVQKLDELKFKSLKKAMKGPDGRIYILDHVEKTLYILTQDWVVEGIIKDRLVLPSDFDFDSRGNIYIADPGARAVLKYDSEGNFLMSISTSFLGNTINPQTRPSALSGLKSPDGVNVFKNYLLISDLDRIVFLPLDIKYSQPEVEFIRNDAVQISWMIPYSPDQKLQPLLIYERLLERTPSFTEVEPEEKRWYEVEGVIDTAAIEALPDTANLIFAPVTVDLTEQITPSTRYSFWIKPAVKTIPDRAYYSSKFKFTTPPRNPDYTQYLKLPVMILVYKNVTYRDAYPPQKFPDVPSPRVLSDEEIEYIRNSASFNSDFYFRNSGCKFYMDFYIYIVDDTLGLKEIGQENPYWLGPNPRVERDFEKAAEHFGYPPEFFTGVIAIYSWLNYENKEKSIQIKQAYGGGTNGIPAPWKYGKTTGYTGNPFPGMASRQDWLITHEFHHQIDALHSLSGYDQYYHADMPWVMPGSFGGDFDFNAEIIRKAPPEKWLHLEFGSIENSVDVDRDGVPDDDPSLPFDELRLNGSRISPDTDGDGLPDLEEIMAGNEKGAKLNIKDTDGDGLMDSEDPLPLYPLNPVIRKVIHEIDGELEDSWQRFYRIKDRGVEGETYLNWDDDNLYFAYSLNINADLLLEIDTNNDGWFHGKDNIHISVKSPGRPDATTDVFLWDASSWSKVPVTDREVIDPTAINYKFKLHMGVYTLELAVPGNEKAGLTFKKGDEIGIRVGLKPPDKWYTLELFERNDFVPIILGE